MEEFLTKLAKSGTILSYLLYGICVVGCIKINGLGLRIVMQCMVGIKIVVDLGRDCGIPGYPPLKNTVSQSVQPPHLTLSN